MLPRDRRDSRLGAIEYVGRAHVDALVAADARIGQQDLDHDATNTELRTGAVRVHTSSRPPVRM